MLPVLLEVILSGVGMDLSDSLERIIYNAKKKFILTGV